MVGVSKVRKGWYFEITSRFKLPQLVFNKRVITNQINTVNIEILGLIWMK